MGPDDDLIRVRLDLAYDGSDFHGWAKQPGLRTVEGELQSALQTVFQTPIVLSVAGRTDAGVHAVGQVAAADLPASHETLSDLDRLSVRLNRLLTKNQGAAVGVGSDVVVQRITKVPADFDARFSAIERTYRYRLVALRAARSPLHRNAEWWLPYQELDVEAMNRAAARLVGTHDFLSFCKPRPNASTIRTLRTLKVTEQRGSVVVETSADAFCHSMVRSLVGALVEVGRGARDSEWAASLVSDPSRDHGVPVAPAHGLTMVGVTYPNESEFKEAARRAMRLRDASELKSDEDSGTLSPVL